jgi:CheY-like chemotaxis protein
MATRIFETPSVLLVIDAQAERDMFAEALRAAGYRTIKAATGIAAIQIAATTPPGIIVTDVRRLSGIVPATAAQIKNGGGCPRGR